MNDEQLKHITYIYLNILNTDKETTKFDDLLRDQAAKALTKHAYALELILEMGIREMEGKLYGTQS